MREILFRAKTSSEVTGFNKKKDNIWVYGFYRDKVGCPTISEFDTYCADYIDYEIDRETLGQYTGLTDKNGIKIFEGDIVKVNNKYIDIVIYASGCFCMDRQIINYEFTYQDSESLEVIGNIHDNPELLEVDDA